MNGQNIKTYRALDSKVLVVAVERLEGKRSDGKPLIFWCAYIGAVRGQNHSDEMIDVARHGSKLHESIALAIFPQFKGTPYAW